MAMNGYTKLFNSILASTIWRADDQTRLVWITMLAMADKHGLVEASIPGLADFARVPLEACQRALEALSGPDEFSRTKESDGRRIEAVDGGWRLLNHSKYRQKLGADERREYLRMKQRQYRQAKRQHRVDKRSELSTTVATCSAASTRLTHTEAEAEATTEATTKAFSDLKEQAIPEKRAGTTTSPTATARSKRPIFTGTRFVVFEWQLDDLRRLLGKHIDDFDIDEWFHTLNQRCEKNGEIIPQRDGGKWLQEQTLREAQRRGLQLASQMSSLTAANMAAGARWLAGGAK